MSVEARMERIFFAHTSSRIDAAKVARFVRFEAELPNFGVSVLFEPGSAIGCELGIQVPGLFSIESDGRLAVPADAGLLLEKVRDVSTTRVSVVIIGAGHGFIAAARSYLEGNSKWEATEPLTSPTLMLYDLVDRRVRYVNFQGNPQQAPWRSY